MMQLFLKPIVSCYRLFYHHKVKLFVWGCWFCNWSDLSRFWVFDQANCRVFCFRIMFNVLNNFSTRIFWNSFNSPVYNWGRQQSDTPFDFLIFKVHNAHNLFWYCTSVAGIVKHWISIWTDTFLLQKFTLGFVVDTVSKI